MRQWKLCPVSSRKWMSEWIVRGCAYRCFGESSTRKGQNKMLTKADSDGYPKQSIKFSTCFLSLSLSLPFSHLLIRLADRLSEHASLHLAWVSQVTAWLSYTSSTGNSDGTGFSLVRAQSLRSGDVNKILGLGPASRYTGTQTNKHMETLQRQTDLTLAGWCHLIQNKCLSFMLQEIVQ